MPQRAWLLICLVTACTRGDAPPPPAQAATPASEQVETKPQVPPLSAEDIALIEADPKTLTPEMRRKRAHALRRKVMQNPDSPAAQSLEALRKSIESGEMQVTLPGAENGITFQPRQKPSTSEPAAPTPTPSSAEPSPEPERAPKP